MFVGHEFLAFALVGWGARRVGFGARAALSLGAVAALAALLPDLDVAYAAATYAVAVADGVPLGWEAFWGVANGVHRVATHPLPVGAVATLVFGAAAATFRRRPTTRISKGSAGLAAAAALAGAALLLSAFRTAVSPSAAAVAAAFLACVGVAGALVGRRTDLSSPALTAAAGVGFLTHPFGDVFLAAPPPLLSPFGPPVLVERVSLAADPTLDLLAVLFVEVATVWAGAAVLSRLGAGRLVRVDRLRDAVDPRAALGVAYAGAAFVLPPPTIADAHLLGFTVVPLAVLVAVWAGRAERSRTTPSGGGNARPAAYGEAAAETGGGTVVESESDTENGGWPPASGAPTAVDAAYVGLVTGLATLTVAAVGYAVAYHFV